MKANAMRGGEIPFHVPVFSVKMKAGIKVLKLWKVKIIKWLSSREE